MTWVIIFLHKQTKWIAYTAIPSMFAYLWISQEVVYVLTALIFIDVLTGIAKHIVHGTVRSRSLSAGLISKLILLLIPLTLWLVGKSWGYDLSTLVTVAVSVLAVWEWYSILANIYEIQTKKKLEEFNVVGLLIQKLASFLKSLLDKDIEKV